MKTLLKTALLIALALVLGEAILRIQEPFLHLIENGPNAELRTLLVAVDNPKWEASPRPNSHIEYPSHDPQRFPAPVIFHFNKQGCRQEEDLAVPKPAGVTRILVLGDSFTEGAFNNAEDSAAARLQIALQKKNPGRKYEVVNCGFSAYSPILHYIRLRDQFLALQPDAVIVNVDNTDIYDDYWRYRPFAKFGPDGEPLLVHRSGRTTRLIKETAWYYSDLFRYAFYLSIPGGQPASYFQLQAAELPSMQKPGDAMIYFYSLPPESAEWKTTVGFCLQNIERISSLLRAKGIQVAITSYPHSGQLPGPNGSPPTWNRAFEFEIAALCARIHAPFFSAYDGLAAATEKSGRLYWPDDMHFTPQGERIWSDLIANWWVNQ